MEGNSFVRIVETLLASRGISKTEFYAKSGISDASMSQYRTAFAKSPRTATIKKAADFFGMSVDEFQNYFSPETKKAPVPEDEGLDREMMEQLRALDSEGIRALKAFLSAYNGGNKK